MSAPVPPTAPSVAPRENPYVGPRAFTAAETLFGREHETETLTNLVVAERVVLLHAQSGAGKTSILQASVMPALAAEGFVVHPASRVSRLPERPVAASHNRYVLSVLIDLEAERTPARLPEELAGYTLDGYLAEWARERTERGAVEGAPEVLVLDQFEEVLTLDETDLAAKAEFFRQLGTALLVRTRWAVLAMREEHIGALDPYLDLLPTRLASRYRLELLSPAAARDSIRRPAEAKGVTFTPQAVEVLVTDLRRVRHAGGGSGGTGGDGGGDDKQRGEYLPGPYVEPVYLQVACTNLWNGLPAGATTIDADYAAKTDVDGALGAYYAAAVARAAQTGTDEQALRDWVERELITPTRLRDQAPQGSEEKYGVGPGAIGVLRREYVIRREERRGGVWYELAHDRLIGPVFANNAAWRDRSLDSFDRMAYQWDRAGRPDNMLLRNFFAPSDRHGRVMTPTAVWKALRRRVEERQAGRLRDNPVTTEFVRRSQKVMWWWVGRVYGVAAVVFGVAFGAVALWERDRDQRGQVAAAEAYADTLRFKNESLRVFIDSLRYTTKSLQRADSTYRAAAWGLDRADSLGVRQSIAANRALQTLNTAGSGVSRESITIEYFPKRRDPERVEFALRDLGYRVTIRPPNAEDLPTNSLSFDPAIPIADVRVIALAVARTGAVLRRVCPFRNTAGRRQVVQVLGASSAAALPPLDVAALDALTPDRALGCGGSVPAPTAR